MANPLTLTLGRAYQRVVSVHTDAAANQHLQQGWEYLGQALFEYYKERHPNGNPRGDPHVVPVWFLGYPTAEQRALDAAARKEALEAIGWEPSSPVAPAQALAGPIPVSQPQPEAAPPLPGSAVRRRAPAEVGGKVE